MKHCLHLQEELRKSSRGLLQQFEKTQAFPDRYRAQVLSVSSNLRIKLREAFAAHSLWRRPLFQGLTRNAASALYLFR